MVSQAMVAVMARMACKGAQDWLVTQGLQAPEVPRVETASLAQQERKETWEPLALDQKAQTERRANLDLRGMWGYLAALALLVPQGLWGTLDLQAPLVLWDCLEVLAGMECALKG